MKTPQVTTPTARPSSSDRSQAMIEIAPYVEHMMRVWVQHVDDFGYTRTASDKMPRADAWRPYRFAVQDTLLALVSMRHAKALNCIEIDVFLAADPYYENRDSIPEGQDLYPYEPLAAYRALCLMVFSEAFRCGTPMALRFTKNVERSDEERAKSVTVGRVPFAVVRLAEIHGTPVPDRESGALGPAEVIPLYAALCGFAPDVRTRIDELAAQGLLTVERACYLVQHGVWSVHELDGLIRGCPYPDIVLDGEIQPETRHLYAFAQSHARRALIGGVLDRALLARDPRAPSDGEPLQEPKGRSAGAKTTAGSFVGKDIEDDDRALEITFDTEMAARRYRLGPLEVEPLKIPDWRPFSFRVGAPRWAAGVGKDVTLLALLRPREEAELARLLSADLQTAGRQAGENVQPAVVVPLDFNDMPLEVQERFLSEADAAGAWLLVCPETIKNLDVFAREKFNRSRVLPD